jgi:hypothetical protein
MYQKNQDEVQSVKFMYINKWLSCKNRRNSINIPNRLKTAQEIQGVKDSKE